LDLLKKKVVSGVIVVYVFMKIFTKLNKIENQGYSQTLAISTKPVIERIFSNDELVILRRNSTKAVQISNLKYLNYDKMEGNFNQALILSQKIESVNSNINLFTTPTIICKTLQIKPGDFSNCKF